jgi:HAMP domain-containing protein
LEAILERAAKLTDKRNDLLHSLWAHESDGSPVIRDEVTYIFKEIPSIDELEALAQSLAEITEELNHARRKGFLHEALEAKKKK